MKKTDTTTETQNQNQDQDQSSEQDQPQAQAQVSESDQLKAEVAKLQEKLADVLERLTRVRAENEQTKKELTNAQADVLRANMANKYQIPVELLHSTSPEALEREIKQLKEWAQVTHANQNRQDQRDEPSVFVPQGVDLGTRQTGTVAFSALMRKAAGR